MAGLRPCAISHASGVPSPSEWPGYQSELIGTQLGDGFTGKVEVLLDASGLRLILRQQVAVLGIDPVGFDTALGADRAHVAGVVIEL